LDDEFAAIAGAESTFAGMYLDSTHTPVVLLTDVGRLAAARTAGMEASLRKRRISTSNIHVLPARYGFGSLKRWFDLAWNVRLPGVISADIDEVHNVLSYGADTPADREAMISILTRLGIPPEAIVVHLEKPATFMSYDSSSVDDSVRPLRGGLKLAFRKADGTPDVCTVGLVVQHGGSNYAITNAHCAAHRDTLADSTTYWQNTLAHGGDSVGQKAALYPAASYSYCGSYTPCKRADAEAILIPSTLSGGASKGLIARTIYYSTDSIFNGDPSYLERDTVNHGLFITDSVYPPLVGGDLWKTGAITGTTAGVVRATCRTHINQENQFLLCQTYVHFAKGNGDSGSPVYQWYGWPTDSTVALAGIFWGAENGDSSGIGHVGIVSPLAQIDSDLVAAGFGRLDFLAYVPPFTVDLAGPSLVGQWTQCVWTATPAHGTGPYTYYWSAPYSSQEDDNIGGSDDFGYLSDTQNFGVSVTVVDAQSNQAYNSIGVSVTGYPGECG
jgi:hypothetical protein